MIAPTNFDNYGNFEAVSTNMPPLGLAYICSAFEEVGCQVDFRDYQLEKTRLQVILDEIADGHYQLVGMQINITNVNSCLKLANLVKQTEGSIRIILGGAHATIFPDDVIKNPAVDYLCVGEGEKTVKELVQCIENDIEPEEVQGLYYRDKKGLVHKNPLRPLVNNIDELPVPKYALFNPSLYSPPVQIRGRRVFIIMTSRGCPYKCSFCASSKVWGGRIRYQSIDRTMAEMRLLKEKFAVDSLEIYDDNFAANRKRVKELCQRMIDEKLGIQWMCFTRADHLDDREMLRLMKQSGCYLIVLGIENGNNRILEMLNKQLDLTVAKKNIELVNQIGILVQSSFMIGLPTETYEEIQNTISYSIKIGLTYAVYPIFTPFPGTPIYNLAIENGCMEDLNFDKFVIWGNGVYSSKDMTPRVYRKLQKQAFMRFYFRPQILWRIGFEMLRLPIKRMINFILGGLAYFVKPV